MGSPSYEGERHSPIQSRRSRSGFNGAAIIRGRKEENGRGGIPWVAQLQWGRHHTRAEGRACTACICSRPSCFNGAAIIRGRKGLKLRAWRLKAEVEALQHDRRELADTITDLDAWAERLREEIERLRIK